MNSADRTLHWSFSCGTWFRTDVRVSYFFPAILLLTLVLFWAKPLLGLAWCGIFILTTILHEFAHVLVARGTGGSADQIILWPFGGLAFVRPASTFRSRFWTPAAGPLANLAICLIVLPALWKADRLPIATNLLKLPIDEIGTSLLLDLQTLIFWINAVQLVINLFPVYPLDGGQMLLAALTARQERASATVIYLRIGFLVALLAMFAGLIASSHWIVFLGAVVVMLNMKEQMRFQSAQTSEDDSFLGYDFSAGYTSLEQSVAAPSPPKPNWLARWKQRRRDARELQERKAEAEVEAQLDQILIKINTTGMQSLSAEERRILELASARKRVRGTGSQGAK